MAKIIASKEIDETAIFFTNNRPTEGTKVLFLSTEVTNGILASYDKEEDGKKVYANGIRCILSDELGLRPYVLPVNDFMAQSAEMINGTFIPQNAHKVTKMIGRYGTPYLQELGNGCNIAVVAGMFPMKVKKIGSTDTYNWTTLGLDESSETYTIKDGVITFGEQKITLEECLKFFGEQLQKQTERLNK